MQKHLNVQRETQFQQNRSKRFLLLFFIIQLTEKIIFELQQQLALEGRNGSEEQKKPSELELSSSSAQQTNKEKRPERKRARKKEKEKERERDRVCVQRERE